MEVSTGAERATLQLGSDFVVATGIDADSEAHPAVEAAEVEALGPPVRLVT